MTSVWCYWTGTSDSTATTNAATSNDGVWGVWINGTSATTSSASTGNIWIAWNEETTGGTRAVYRTYQPPEPTAEEKEQARLRQEQMRIENERIAKEKAEADERAKELLKLFLTPEQRQQFDESGFFLVKKAKKTYKVKLGWSSNVEELDEKGKKVASYCAHPSEIVPNADNMLAQKIMLENDEPGFLRIANRFQN